MINAKIMIVEDNNIVALDLKKRLENLNYKVTNIFARGEDALESVDRSQPDVIIMDIKLKGELDGITTTELISRKYDIPVIFFTAYTSEKLLSRAKLTRPYSYIVKPFNDRELSCNIEIALYNHKLKMKLEETEQWLQNVLMSVGDAIIVADSESRIRLINDVAEKITGYDKEESIGQKINQVFHIVDEEMHNNLGDPVQKVFKHGKIIGYPQPILMITKDNKQIPIEFNASPVRNERKEIVGAVLAFNDITMRRNREREKDELISKLVASKEEINELRGMIPICANCKRVRDDKGYWESVEKYISDHSKIQFTHGICPECMAKLYPYVDDEESGDTKIKHDNSS